MRGSPVGFSNPLSARSTDDEQLKIYQPRGAHDRRRGRPGHGPSPDLLRHRGSCHNQVRSRTFYEPLHDIMRRQAGPWLAVLTFAALPLRPDGMSN